MNLSLRFTNTTEEILAVMTVTMVKVKMRKGNVKNRHYNINILFIYSEQMTESDIENDQNDHDQMTT